MRTSLAFSAVALTVLASGCFIDRSFRTVGDGYDAASEALVRTVGPTSWAYGADIGVGKVVAVEKRTRANGRLQAKFRDGVECWTVGFEKYLDDGIVVKCQAILPLEWNGCLWLVANDGVGGELPERAVAFTKDGSAVVCGDGGMGQVYRRNGVVNPIAAGAQSKSLRKAFFLETLAATLEGGKALVEGRYGRPADKVLCYGRETGGARALQLASQDPKAVNGLFLVNPAVDFTACAAYDINIARQAAVGSTYGRLLRTSQFEALKRAVGEMKAESFDPSQTNALWMAASKYDDSFLYNPDAVKKICDAWHRLFIGGTIKSGDKFVPVPPVRFEMDFENRLRARSWRLAWLYGENETGAEVTDDAFISHLDEMAEYSPKVDLKPYFEAGGKAVLVAESANSRVPAQVVEPLATHIPNMRRVIALKDDVKEAQSSFQQAQ